MSLLAPSALWLLLLIPPIVLLYFMKLRRESVRVPAGFLWQRALEQARAESFFERLKVNLLLLLQILAVALLALALARPFRTVLGTMPAHAILVVDRSASMQAAEGSATRFTRARAAAVQMVREAPPGTSFMVISATTQARVELPFTDDRETVARLLGTLEPLDTGTRLEPAMRLALSLSRQFGDAEVAVFSDTDPLAVDERGEGLDAVSRQELSRRLRLVAVGGPSRNAAVTALEARAASGGRLDVLVGVRSFSSEPLRGFLELHRGGRLVDARQLDLKAGGRKDAVFHIDESGDDTLEARLAVTDDLEVDNHAWTVLPRAAVLRVLLVSAGNPFLEKALTLLPGARVFRVAPSAYRGSDAYALTVWDDAAPPAGLRGSHLVLHPHGSALLQAEDERPGPFTVSVNADHPLFRWVDWTPVHVRSMRRLVPPSWGTVVARAGDLPVVVLLERADLRAVVVAFDLFASDAPLSPAFPIFLANVAGWLTGTGAAAAPPHVATEAPVPLDFLRTGEPYEATLPSGETLPPVRKTAGLTFSRTDHQGVYTFKQGERTYRVAVDLADPLESSLAAASSTAAGEPRAASVTRPRMVEYWWLAIIAVLGVMMGEWVVYHQRR